MMKKNRGQRFEFGSRNAEVGPVVVPKERDYAAAKDAEVGKQKVGRI